MTRWETTLRNGVPASPLRTPTTRATVFSRQARRATRTTRTETSSPGSRSFGYDLANRLTATTQGSSTTTYSYDGDGVRLQASAGPQANRKTNFLWDVNGGLPQIALERDGNGRPLRRYVYGVRRISPRPRGTVRATSSTTRSARWSTSCPRAGRRSGRGRTSRSARPEPRPRPRATSRTPTSGSRAFSTRPGSITCAQGSRPGEWEIPTTGSRGSVTERPRDLDVLVRGKPSDRDGRSVGRDLHTCARRRRLGWFAASAVDWGSPDIRCQTRACGGRPPRSPIECGARPGHPLSRVGTNAGGRAGHRAKPLTGWKSDNAQDITVPVGTRVCAVFGGRVESANSEASDGLTITIAGRSDRVFYHHLSERFVERGQRVRLDQVLGRSGRSSNGAPHLHIALERGNPERYPSGPYLGRCF